MKNIPLHASKGYPELRPGGSLAKKLYIALMLWIVGRAIQVAAKVDAVIREELENLPDKFSFSLGVLPAGPTMVMGYDKKGEFKYMGSGRDAKPKLRLGIKSMDAAFLVFTFQESTAVAFARDRFVADGDLPAALSVVRILDRVEVLLLPKIIAKLAVKRYPTWKKQSPLGKWKSRLLVYLRVFTIG
jgi:hypothetical protein